MITQVSAFGQNTATGLAALLSHEISQDAVQQFLLVRKQTSAELWLIVNTHVRNKESAEGLLINADSMADKTYMDIASTFTGTTIILTDERSWASTFWRAYIAATLRMVW